MRRGIKHPWVFMLIGQIVAISFATNLFLLALLLSPPVQPPTSNTAPAKQRWSWPWLINFAAVIATVYPAYLLADEEYWHSASFMIVLMIPHVALLVLPTVRALVPQKYFKDDDARSADGLYKYLWMATILGGAFCWCRVTILAYNYGGIEGIARGLFEHAAVSSVGWDTIWCWVSWFMWWRVQRGLDGLNSVEEKRE